MEIFHSQCIGETPLIVVNSTGRRSNHHGKIFVMNFYGVVNCNVSNK